MVGFARGERDGFEFVLARELSMTVGELRGRMSMREFMEWAAFYRLESERAHHARKLKKGR